MSTYQSYKDARNAAWHALLQLQIASLPVDMDAVMEKLHVELHPFPIRQEEPKLYALLQRTGPSLCVTLRIQDAWHVFFRHPGATDAERRFALAHELGHILLRHETFSLSPGVLAFSALENEGDILDDPQDAEDYAADVFASRFLSPACVLHELHLDTAAEITRLCGLPPRAAIQRAERMELLNERDAFFTSPDETKVRDQFLPFIRAQHPAFAIPEAAAKPDEISEAKAPSSSSAPPPDSAARKKIYLSSSLLVLLAAALILASYFGLFPFTI